MSTPTALSPDTPILLIGAGYIAAEYIKALHALGMRNITVLARGTDRAHALKEQYGLCAAHGGGESTLPSLLADAAAVIVAPSIEVLPTFAALLAEASHPRVLLEKPAFLSSHDLEDFRTRYGGWECAVALNRLFYPSVRMLAERIAQEGIRSATFSFTEWLHRIEPNDYTRQALARWGLSNCIHVISTAFHLIGLPAQLHARQEQGEGIAWHPAGTIFTGAGISSHGTPFTYHSDWGSAGRWSIEIYNNRGAYSLCPMEGLSFKPKGSVTSEGLLPVWNGDTKCGFEAMLAGFLSGQDYFSLSQLSPHLEAIEAMFGYSHTP